MSARLICKTLALLLVAAAPSAGAEGLTREQGDEILRELRALRAAVERLGAREVAARAAPPARPARELEVPLADGNRIGSSDAPLTLVQFTDYQCPYCARFFRDVLPEIKENYIDSGKLQLVVHDLPLDFHANAASAAHAARCAADQGRFAAMHDTLYGNAQALDEAALSEYAANIGLDRAAFDDCMESGRHRESIARGAAATQALGITGTPTFVLGRAVEGKVKGPQILGAQPAAAFAARIDALLEQGG